MKEHARRKFSEPQTAFDEAHRQPEAACDRLGVETLPDERLEDEAFVGRVHRQTLEILGQARLLPGLRLDDQAADRMVFRQPSFFGELSPVTHPVVIEHPESKVRSMVLSPMCYVRLGGIDRNKGDELFDQLVMHSFQERYRSTHHWSRNDLVLFDNRRTMHFTPGYPYSHTRLIHRTTFKADMATGRICNT